MLIAILKGRHFNLNNFFKTYKKTKISILIFACILLILATAFLICTAFPYKADSTALTLLTNDNIEVFADENIIAVYPENDTDTALMFYPGGNVEYEAYLPLLVKLQEELGIMCVMAEMPFNMAIFDTNRGDDIIQKFPEIENWYICGHSLGGITASMYAADNKQFINALIVLGSYLYDDYPVEKTLTIYGSFNSNLEDSIDYTENIFIIEGGNHAQFGNYGKQQGDPEATISAQEQQDEAVSIIKTFVSELQK